MSKIRRNILLLPALLFVIWYIQNTRCECVRLKKITKAEIKKMLKKEQEKRILDLTQKENYQKVMSFIHKHGYFDFTREKQKTSLLEMAIYNNSYRDVKALILCGVSPNTIVTMYCISIIFKAIGKPRILELLLQNGAYPNVRYVIGATPLIQATKQNCIDSVRILLKYNANTKKREFVCKINPDGRGKTAFDYAVEKGYEEIARLIREKENACKKTKEIKLVIKKKRYKR